MPVPDVALRATIVDYLVVLFWVVVSEIWLFWVFIPDVERQWTRFHDVAGGWGHHLWFSEVLMVGIAILHIWVIWRIAAFEGYDSVYVNGDGKLVAWYISRAGRWMTFEAVRRR